MYDQHMIGIVPEVVFLEENPECIRKTRKQQNLTRLFIIKTDLVF